ncbi:MAG: hypothetical protein HYY23_16955 [Verrucomicrobia bacterium]|nr:hypothetical protein [Verrucomicrobiota bacterium]
MKIGKQPDSLTVQVPALQHGDPIPYTPDPEEEPGRHTNSPIEPLPPAIRRTLKAKLNRRGPSQPVPITDPWE